MRTVELATHLNAPPDRVWQHVGTSGLLHYIASRLIRFIPQSRTPFPEHWQEGEYRAWMWLFGIVPLGWQAIRISFPEPENGVRYVRDNGYGPLIRRWDHWIEISADSEDGGGTRYVDRVTIDAGLLTPIVASFANIFYRHRQNRWRRLVDNGFDYTR